MTTQDKNLHGPSAMRPDRPASASAQAQSPARASNAPPEGMETIEWVGEDAEREWSDSVMSQEFADSIQSALDDLFTPDGDAKP